MISSTSRFAMRQTPATPPGCGASRRMGSYVSALMKPAACALLAMAPALFAADAASDPAEIHRPSVGFRIECFGNRLFTTSTTQVTTTQPIQSITYASTSHSPKIGIAPTIEYRITHHLSLGLELLFHHAEYTLTENIVSGKLDPNASSDDRKTTTITQNSKINYWEVPLVARWYGFTKSGILSNVYVGGGLEWRHIGRVRTGNEFAYADGVTDYNETPVKPSLTNQAGVVAALGYRAANRLKMKFTPEVRFIRWQGVPFQGPSYRSQSNQVELSLGWSY
jgi:hypothetical protein